VRVVPIDTVTPRGLHWIVSDGGDPWWPPVAGDGGLALGQLERRQMAGTSVFYLEGRHVPRRAQLEVRLDTGWVRGSFAYPEMGSERPTFTGR